MSKNEAKENTSVINNIWCTTCGDTTIYTPDIRWHIKDEDRGIGICTRCAKVLNEEDLALPDKSEDGYATFT